MWNYGVSMVDPLAVSWYGRKREWARVESSGGSSYKDTSRITGALTRGPHLTLITSQRPHLRTPSHWDLRPKRGLWGDENISWWWYGKREEHSACPWKALRKRRLCAGGEPSSGSQHFSVTVQFFSMLQVTCDEPGSSISLSSSLSLFP